LSGSTSNLRLSIEVLISEQVGCDILESETIIQDSLETLIMQVTPLPEWDEPNCEIVEEREVHLAEVQAPPIHDPKQQPAEKSQAGAKLFERFGTHQ
jgi:hypothetical protein